MFIGEWQNVKRSHLNYSFLIFYRLFIFTLLSSAIISHTNAQYVKNIIIKKHLQLNSYIECMRERRRKIFIIFAQDKRSDKKEYEKIIKAII